MLTACTRLDEVPLNPSMGFFPFVPTDSISLHEPRFAPIEVRDFRRQARLRRHAKRTSRPGDLIKPDWEFALAGVATEEPDLLLGSSSYIAVDTILEDGRQILGTRPVLGQRARKREPRTPSLRGLQARRATDASLKTLCEADLLLLNLSAARTRKAAAVMHEVLRRRPPNLPTLIVAETATDLGRFIEEPLLQRTCLSIDGGVGAHAPSIAVTSVGRERAQHEQELLFALDDDDVVESDRRLKALLRTAWRFIWQRVDPTARQTPLLRVINEELESMRRRSETAADRYALALSLVTNAPFPSEPTAVERLQALRRLASSAVGRQPVVIVVGDRSDEAHLLALLTERSLRSSVRVRTIRDLTIASARESHFIVAGYWGSHTTDAILRSRPASVSWILDPVEAGYGARDLARQEKTLERLSLNAAANVVHSIRGCFEEAAAGVRLERSTDHPSILDLRVEQSEWRVTSPITSDESPWGSQVELCFDDGSVLRVEESRRFDVVRSGQSHPIAVAAKELSEGDQVLVVRGIHQRTLSELLLEDLDARELSEEAAIRTQWQKLCRTLATSKRLTAGQIARDVIARGGNATRDTVRAWLTPNSEAVAPRDYATFVAFSEACGVQLPMAVLEQFFGAIRRWRAAHRRRGRDIVRLLRLAWFGGLSASDLARVEQRWGLGVRDLVEGSRVLEIESVHSIANRLDARSIRS